MRRPHNRTTLASWLVASLLVMLVSNSASAEEMLHRWVDSKAFLSPAGQYVMPDLRESLVNPDYPEAVTFTQTPQAGTTFTGPQAVFVSVTATDASANTEQRRFRLDLIDRTEPTVQLTLSASGPARTSAHGMLYYRAPVTVTPAFAASDTADTQPIVEAVLDGQKYVPGTPITTMGYHSLRITATDRSGNAVERSALFEVRDRFSYGAAAIVSDYQSFPGGGGIVGINATLLVRARIFR